jgi:rifamycin polyketide synthase module 1/2/3
MLRTELIRPIPLLLDERAERYRDKIAFYDARRSVSYAELACRTARMAGHLAALGVRRGDRVLIYMDNRVETAESYLASARASAVGVCVNPMGARPEIGYMLQDSGARVVLTDEAHLENVRLLLAEQAATDVTVVVVGDGEPPEGALSYERLATVDAPQPPRDDLALDDVAWMLYTSGTTGRPKGVLLTQRSCLWVVAACWAPIAGLSEGDHVLCPLPLFHSYALVLGVLGVFAVGATERIMAKFSTTEVLEQLRTRPFTVMPGVPTMFQYLLQAAKDEGLKAASLRMCVSAGAIMPASLNRAFEETFRVQLLEGYGITETSTMVTMNWPTGGREMGSCGLPVPGVGVRLVDPATGQDVGAGQAGELWVSGPNVMAGYHNRPESTAEVLQQGWYRTGDLGYRDDNGFLTISGRTKELIIRGGENIYPAEVEDVLMAVDGIADAAVVAKPHDDLGEVPVAFVVPERPGHLDVDAVLTACRDELSHFKVPDQLLEITEIPRTGSGKILRYRLQELLKEGLAK